MNVLIINASPRKNGAVSQMLAAMQEAGVGLKSLLAELKLYPQRLINVPVARGVSWRDHPQVISAQKDVEDELAGRGRVLLRASGTEPLLRVMVEGEDASEVAEVAELLAGVVRRSAG